MAGSRCGLHARPRTHDRGCVRDDLPLTRCPGSRKLGNLVDDGVRHGRSQIGCLGLETIGHVVADGKRYGVEDWEGGRAAHDKRDSGRLSTVVSRHASPMDFTGRPLSGMVYVAAAGLAGDRELEAWVERGVDSSGPTAAGEALLETTLASSI